MPYVWKIVAVLLLTVSGPPVVLGQEQPVSITYYGEIGCNHCDTFIDSTVPEVEASYGIAVEVTTYDILQATHYVQCRDALAELDRSFRVFPVLFIGNNAYQGNRAIARGLHAELAYLQEHGQWRSPVPATMDGSQPTDGTPAAGVLDAEGVLPLVPVVLAGLADGVNPCAFATVIFLLSVLALVGRSPRQTLLTGLVFAATVFTTYLAIGFGLLTVLRAVMNSSSVGVWLRIIVSVGTAVLAILSLRDAVHISQGHGSKVVLGLSSARRKRINSVIRNRVRGGGLVVATVSLALVVSVLELACTGQLYLPTIAYLVQSGSPRGREVFALVVYNLAFIVPLLVVVLAAVYGVNSRRIAAWFSRRLVTAKVLMGLAFLLLGAAIWMV